MILIGYYNLRQLIGSKGEAEAHLNRLPRNKFISLQDKILNTQLVLRVSNGNTDLYKILAF